MQSSACFAHSQHRAAFREPIEGRPICLPCLQLPTPFFTGIISCCREWLAKCASVLSHPPPLLFFFFSPLPWENSHPLNSFEGSAVLKVFWELVLGLVWSGPCWGLCFTGGGKCGPPRASTRAVSPLPRAAFNVSCPFFILSDGLISGRAENALLSPCKYSCERHEYFSKPQPSPMRFNRDTVSSKSYSGTQLLNASTLPPLLQTISCFSR